MGDREEVIKHLNWSCNDWGINEGADEAITMINAAASAGYGAHVAGVVSLINGIPGLSQNILKRPPVMDAAKALVSVAPDLAVDLALTTQAHNGGVVRNYLNTQRPLVVAYLRGQL